MYAPLGLLQVIYNSQAMESTQVPISRQVDKEALAHLHNGILLGP